MSGCTLWIVGFMGSRMVKWMDGHTIKTDGPMHGWVDGWMGGCMDGRCMQNKLARRMHGITVEWMDRCMHGWMHGTIIGGQTVVWY